MEKIEITICTGTTCYVMGAGNLLMLTEHLDEAIASRVEIKGSGCLGLCKEGQYGKAPYVMIGDSVISEATVETVLEELKKRIAQ